MELYFRGASKTNVPLVSVLLVGAILENAFVSGQELYGASVHWRPHNNSDRAIVLSVRLIWEMDPRICRPVIGNDNKFEICASKQIKGGSTTVVVRKPFQGYTFQCVDGCISATTVSNLSDLYYTDIGKFYEITWEAGVEMRTFTFDSQDDVANVKLGFLYPNGSYVPGLGEAHLSMAIRNDTNRPNISPLLNVFPVYRIPLGCYINIKLFPFDGDGDYVKCHWERFPDEKKFGQGAVLYEDSCEMRLEADSRYQEGDQLFISLYAQDYSREPVQLSGVSVDVTSGPFSRTPLKFLVYIGTATTCTPGPGFTKSGSLVPYYKHSYTLPFSDAKLPFEVPNEQDDVITTGPRYMIFEERINITRIDEGQLTYLNDTAMKGIHQACGIAYSKDGVPGDSRCAVLMVEEPNECLSNPCTDQPGGICDNLFEYYTCTYPGDTGYASSRWTNGCQNVTKVEKADDNLTEKIAIPVGLSLLWLLVVVGVTCYMKRYFTEKLRNATVEPEMATKSNGLTTAVAT